MTRTETFRMHLADRDLIVDAVIEGDPSIPNASPDNISIDSVRMEDDEKLLLEWVPEGGIEAAVDILPLIRPTLLTQIEREVLRQIMNPKRKEP